MLKEMEETHPSTAPTKPNRSQIQGHFAISLAGSDKAALNELKNKLIDLALNHPKIGMGHVRVPESISSLLNEFNTLKKQVAYLRWADYRALYEKLGMVLTLTLS